VDLKSLVFCLFKAGRAIQESGQKIRLSFSYSRASFRSNTNLKENTAIAAFAALPDKFKVARH